MHEPPIKAIAALDMLRDVYQLWLSLPVPEVLSDRTFDTALKQFFSGITLTGTAGNFSSAFERDAIAAALIRDNVCSPNINEAAYTLSIVRLNLGMIHYLHGEFHRALDSAFQAARMIECEYFKPKGNIASVS